MEDTPPVVIELNPREQRLYDRLRALVVDPHPGEASGLRDLLLLFPDLAVLLMRLLAEKRVPRGAKWVASLAFAYVLSPIDLLPAVLLGPLGLLDDLLFVAGALSLIINRVHPDVIRQHWSGQGDALRAIQRVMRFGEAYFGKRVALLFGTGARPGRSR